MSKRKRPALENPIARDIFHELNAYATDKQFYPLELVLYFYMHTPQYNQKTGEWEAARYPNLSKSTFRWWFARLVEDGHIEIDFATRSIRCVHLEIVEKGDNNP